MSDYARRPGTASSFSSVDPTGALRKAARSRGYDVDRRGQLVKTHHKNHNHRQLSMDETRRVMRQAVSMGKTEVVEDTVRDETADTTMRRVLVRRVEVPVNRRVKVPVRTTAIEPVTRTQRVKVKRLVEVPSYKEVEEEYTEVAHRTVMRDKEIWVKKVVQEAVEEPYEVKKTRVKRVPVTELKEVEEWQDVAVTEDEAVTREGYRVDEVQDTKVIEVQEEQVYELVPRPLETRYIGALELGMSGKRHIGRSVGDRTYLAEDVAGIELDKYPSIDIAPMLIQHLRQRLGLVVCQRRGEHSGVRVKLVRSGFPAATAGLRPGDVITHVDGRCTHTLSEFRNAVYKSRKTLNFTVVRSGSSMRISVTKREEMTETTRTWATAKEQDSSSFEATGTSYGYGETLDNNGGLLSKSVNYSSETRDLDGIPGGEVVTTTTRTERSTYMH